MDAATRITPDSDKPRKWPKRSTRSASSESHPMPEKTRAAVERIERLLEFHTPRAVHFAHGDVSLLVAELRRVRADVEHLRWEKERFWKSHLR